MTPTNEPAVAAPGFWDRMGWRATRRPANPFAYVLGAAAGTFAVVATVALVVEVASDNDPTAPGVLLNLALFALAIIAGAKLAGPIRAAAVTALVLTTPLIWTFAFVGDGEGSGRGTITGIYLLSLVTFVVLYLLGWTRGRVILLGAALLFLSGWILFEVGGDSSPVPFETTFNESYNDDSYYGDTGSGGIETGMISLLLGLGQLGAAVALDRRGRSGVSTPFIVVGAVYAVTGAVAIGVSEETAVGGGLLLIIAGAAIGGVGTLGRSSRRGSVWIGMLTIFAGVAVIIGDVAGDGDALSVAGLAALAAVVIGAVAVVLAKGAHEPDDDPTQALPAPPTG